MLKKLRRKFIAIAMISVSIVLIAIVGTINIANYISTNDSLDARLELIAGNDGTFPDLSSQAPEKPGDVGTAEDKDQNNSKFNEVKNHVLYSMKDQRNPYSTTFTGKILMDNYNVAFHYKNFEQSVPSLYIRNYGRNYDCSSNKKISNNNSNEKKSFNKMSFRDNFNYKKAKDVRMRQLQYSEKLERSKGKSKKK